MATVSPAVTILNVDDREISRYTKSRVLRQAGFEVREAITGYESLQMIREERPSLVLLDVGLPDINGLEVCRRIKSDPALALTLVLQISATLVESGDIARGLEGGADAYLAEPVEPEELVATVKALLRLHQAEAELEAQRAFLRQIIDLNPNLIFAKDRQGRFTLANQAMAEVYGTTVEELIGKSDADFAPNPAEAEHFLADDLEVMDSLQEKFIPEETTTDATGQVRWLQTVKRPIVGKDGLAHQVLGVATDITARKQAQAALTQLNETLEQRVRERTALIQLLQEMTAAANEAEMVEETLQFALERVCAYTGWPVGHVYWLDRENPSELVSSSIWHLDEPERFEAFRQVSESTRFPPGVGLPGQVLASGEVTWIGNVSQPPNFPRAQAAASCGLQAGFGFPLWVGLEIVAVLEFFSPEAVEPDGSFMEAVTQIGTQLGRVVERKRAENQIRRLNAELERRVIERTAQLEAANHELAEEINERKEVEEALRQSEKQLRLITDAAPALISYVDAKHRYRFTNRTYETWFGYSPAELPGQYLKDVLGKAAYKTIRPYVETALAGQEVSYEQSVPYTPGGTRYIQAHYVPDFDEQGQVRGFVSLVYDITERKRAELGQRLLAEAGKVLASPLDYIQRLSNVAQLAVPDLADWCAVNLYEEDWTVHQVAVAHVDPAKVELAHELQQRYPPRREELMKGSLPWQQGESQLYPEITEAMLEAAAQDAEHYQILRDLNLQSAIVAPLLVRERVLGVMFFVWAESGRRYDEHDLALAQELARRTAVAVDNARLYEAEQRARQAAEHIAERITGLQVVTAALSRAITSAQVIEVIIEQSIGVLEASGGAVMLVTEEGDSLEIVQAIGYSAEGVEPFQRFPLAASIPASDAVRSGEPVWISSHHDFEARYPHLASLRPADSRTTEGAAVLPLQVEGRALGAIAISFDEVRRFSPEDEDFLLTLADLCAQALERAHLYEAERHVRAQAETAGRRLSLLAEASEVLIASTSYETALSNLARLIVPSLADWCVVDLIGEDDLIHRLAVVHRDPAKAELAAQLQRHYPALDPQGEHTISKMLRRGRSWFDAEVSETRLAAEARDAEHLQLLRGLGFASEMVVLLTARGRTLGALTLVRTNVERRYEAADLALAEELARRATITVDNARLYEAEQRARQTAEQVAERMASLQDITAALSEALTPTQVARIIVEQGVPAVGAAGGVVTRLNEDRTELEILHFAGYSPQLMAKWGQRFPVSTPAPLAEATQTGEPVFIESLAELAARYPAMTRRRVSEYQAFVALPLSLEGDTIGGIGLSFVEPQTFNEDEREFMLTLAQQCAQALERARLYEVEQQARAEAEATQQRLALLAEMRERNRLAQELHDTVAQALGYLNLKIGLTHTLLAEDQVDAAKANLQELKNVVGEVYTDVREEIFNLRAKVMSGLGFMEVLDRYIDKYRRFYNLDIQLVQEADPALFNFPVEVTPQIIRTIQEALINIRKHAQVERAIIRLGQENESIRIGIEDQGQGFDLAKIKGKTSSFGLQIMRERVESVGGSLEVDTAPGRGTRIILRYRK